MNIIGWEKDSLTNGDGIRLIIWVSGCERHCKGCQNKEAQNRFAGHEFTTADMLEIFFQLKENDYYSGITFLGGEPLEAYNLREVTFIAKWLRKCFPELTQWLYTGYMWEDIKDYEIMKYLDVVVDGEFRQAEADKTLHWKGSKNQRVISVQKSLERGEVVKHE